MPLIISAVLLAVVLAFAVVRPRGLPEAVAAVPAAGLVIAFGLVSWDDAWAEFRELGPTVGFLAAVLVLAHLAGEHGVFRYAGTIAARRGGDHPPRLLAAVFVAAALTTAFLSLDATVVLLTPVVLATATRVGARARPPAFAAAHLANSASLLLPVSNLTNLLAFAASGLTFLGFTALMILPWLAVIAVEYLVFRLYFAGDLRAREEPRPEPGNGPAPRYALIVLAVTLVGFAASHSFGVHPAWIAVAGALFLAVPRRVPVTTLIRETNPAFCAFVLALGIVVLAVQQHGLEDLLHAITPDHADLLGLLAVAFLAAGLANVLNNLPATLVMLPVVESKPALLLAMLIGVNVGPNLTYVGSLATLLWRQILHTHDAAPDPRDFLRLGVLTVPPALVAGVLALWLSLKVGG
ncbi:SLC13 family permease [Actinoplanes sp. TRM 88003]|uniref:SLC13 family permease n=1 Tax=Paractinoplanes aksuensis TaxID=2939490 RepID=A0ABT1DSN7_9ACTN|nr:SLC13 family permease [Actinoplanes aksuensis]MCO8273508.1 SLC13 family permease [Actinoplanes aksuensis]